MSYSKSRGRHWTLFLPRPSCLHVQPHLQVGKDMYLSVNGDKRPPITNEPALCKAFFSIYTDADAVAPVARERMASGVASLY